MLLLILGARWLFHRMFTQKKKNLGREPGSMKKFLSLVLTYTCVTFAWILFPPPAFMKSYSLTDVGAVFQSLGNFNFEVLITRSTEMLDIVLYFIFATDTLLVFDIIQMKLKQQTITRNLHWLIRGVVYLVICVLIFSFYKSVNSPPFVYEGF